MDRIITSNYPLHSLLFEYKNKVKVKNKVYIDDTLGRSLNSFFSMRIFNYIIGGIKNDQNNFEGVILFVNKGSRNLENSGFSNFDKLMVHISGYIIILCGKIFNSLNKLEHESSLKSLSFIWTEQLAKASSQSLFVEIMERQIKQLMRVEKVNVIFYDSKRNELYKRFIEDNKEHMKSILI